MALAAFAAPILPGKREQWNSFIDEITGPRRDAFNASRQRYGVHERTFLQETPMGDLVVVTLEGENPVEAFGRIANDDDDFTRWFVQQVQEMHGFDLRQPLENPPHLVVDSDAAEALESLVNGLQEHPAMWAQLIKTRVKPGKDEELGRLFEVLHATEQPDSGLLRSTGMRDRKDPSSLYMMVVFESEEKARAREQDPRREEGLAEARALMADILDGSREFVDLEVVSDLVADPAATAEKNKAVFRRLMDECFVQGNLDLIEEIVSPDWVNIDPSLPEELRGHEGARQLITMWRAGFPDFHIAIDDMVAEGDRVAARFTFTGTHQGEFVGIPPTGKQVQGTGTGIFRFVDGKDVEHRVNFDALGVLQQIGVVPAPEQVGA